MKDKQLKSVDPLFGEEIEWDIIVGMPDGKYRLPNRQEFREMINGIRDKMTYKLIDPEEFLATAVIENLSRDRNIPREVIEKIIEKKESSGFLLSDAGFLPSGSRLYIDCNHLESSSPECSTVKDLIISSKVSEIMLNIGRRTLENRLNTRTKNSSANKKYRVKIYKDTTDRQEATYAGHENYLLNRDTFCEITQSLTRKTLQLASFLALRILLTGAGKLGAQNGAAPTFFQISQRADWIESIRNTDTTWQRPLVNMRNEAHARYTLIGKEQVPVSRLHVICGEPNMSPASMRMRFGYTSLFLLGLQDNIFDNIQKKFILENPIEAIKIVSRDILCRQTLKLMSGQKAKCYELLQAINERLHWYFKEIREPTSEQLATLKEAEYYCESFAKGPKFYFEQLIELDWINRCQACREAGREVGFYTDLDYSDIDQKESIYYLRQKIFEEAGLVRERDKISQEEIDWRFFNPPTNTRAYLRGQCLKRFPELGCDWSIMRFPGQGFLELEDPHKGGAEEIGDIVETIRDKKELLKKLKKMGFRTLY